MYLELFIYLFKQISVTLWIGSREAPIHYNLTIMKKNKKEENLARRSFSLLGQPKLN